MLVSQSTCNEKALAWRVFPSFQPQHNAVDTLDADENTKIKLSHKERMIYTLLYILWPVITASTQYFAPEGKKIPVIGSEESEVYSPSSWLFFFPLKMFLLLQFLMT